MKKSVFFLCALTSFVSAIGQEKFEVKKMGFSINAPKDWFEVKNDQILHNLNQYDLTEAQLNELLTSDMTGTNLVTYTQYDLKKSTGIVPTIKIRTRKTESKTINNFLRSVELSNQDAMRTLENFIFLERPKTTTISGKNTVAFSVQFTLKNNGKVYRITSHSYYILRNGYYISLNFIEETGKENNQELFNNMVKSIVITE